jgi:hypothetical protein
MFLEFQNTGFKVLGFVLSEGVNVKLHQEKYISLIILENEVDISTTHRVFNTNNYIKSKNTLTYNKENWQVRPIRISYQDFSSITFWILTPSISP